MSYQFLDAFGSVLTADSSFVSGVVQRPIVNVGSITGVTLSGAITVNPVALTSGSIVGTYAEDSAHSDGNAGLFVMGVRNDAVASFVSANLDYTPKAVDSAGRTVTKPFAPNEAYTYGVSSTVNTNKSSLLSASGTGLRNYITDVFVANTGSVATLVSFTDSNGSVIGKTIAPATSGSNIIHMATPMRTGSLNSQVEFTAQTAVSVLSVSAFGFIAP